MYINLNNQNVFYQKVGKGGNLVLLHGWGHNSSDFWPLIDDLKDNFTLWLIDLPGFGRSDLPKSTFSISDYAEIIKLFIDKNQIKKPVLLGHSNGGRVSIKLTANYPNLIDKLILEDSAGLKPQTDFYLPIFFLGAKIFRYFIPNWFPFKSQIRYKFYKSIESQDYLKAGPMQKTLTKFLAEDLTANLKKIEAETLIIWGENDSAIPLSIGKRIYQLIPNSRLEVFENVGHFPHLEDKEKFVKFVKDFCI